MIFASDLLADRVPRDEETNVRWRGELLGRAQESKRLRDAVKLTCQADLLFWVNSFVWQFNPNRRTEEVGPFSSWPFQDRAFLKMRHHVETGRDLVIEKSREMGASWMCLLLFDWYFLFHKYKKFLAISRNADAVDRDDPDSLFWKLDFVHKQMPEWLLPKLDRKSMVFKNLDLHSSLTGQASTGKAGVGGRATAMFVDEFAQIDEAATVYDRTADTTGCRIFNSTHVGVGTPFHHLCENGSTAKLRLHWSEHPLKSPGLYRYDMEEKKLVLLDQSYQHPPDYPFILDGKLRSPWYDATCLTRSPRAIACDLDIDPKGAASQFFDGNRIRQLAAHWARKPLWQGEVAHDGHGSEPSLIDSSGGRLSLWVIVDAYGRLPKGRFTLGADVSTGTGATPSCLSILNAHTGEKVGGFAAADYSPDEFAYFSIAVAHLFTSQRGEPGTIAWENAGPGVRYGKCLLDAGFRNIYWHSDASKLNPKPTRSPGFNPHPKAKRLILEAYRSALYDRQMVNPDALALEECLDYEYTPEGKVEHGGARRSQDPSGGRENHGDRVMADALAWMLAEREGFTSRRRSDPDKPPPGDDPPVMSLAWRLKYGKNVHQEREPFSPQAWH